MKTKTLTILLLAILLSACSASAAFQMNSDKVNSAADEITGFDLPAGYQPEFAASLNEYTLISYTPGEGNRHLYLVQSLNEGDAEKLAEAMEKIVPGAGDPESGTKVLETRPVSVRGQESNLVISEGTNSEGVTYRQALVAFEGKAGPALLVFSEPTNRWDPAVVENLLASLD